MRNKENADYLLQAAVQAGISDRRELANFMGQMEVESGGFARLKESLNYSPQRLLEVFRGRNGMDGIQLAEAIVAQGPEGVANAVYGGDWGAGALGNSEQDDGWRYRGRGFVQLTGRTAYRDYGTKLGVDLVGHPELAERPGVAADIAVRYWQDKVVAEGAELDVAFACRVINGGRNGLEARAKAVDAWERRLEHGYKPGDPDPDLVLVAANGERSVRQLQTGLSELGYGDSGAGLHADGRLGPRTRSAVRAFQRDHHLTQDGVAGPATWRALDVALQDSRQVAAVAQNGGSLPSGAAPSIPPHLQDFRHPDHPAHACYTCALQQVHAMEERAGVVHGPHSERAAAAVVAAVAAHDVGKSPMARMDVPAHISLRGEGVAQELVVSAARVNYYQPETTLTLPAEKATAATVEQNSLDWSRLHLPHLHAQLPEHGQDPGRHTATPDRGTHPPQASSHPWYEAVREQIARSYDTCGLPRVGERIDQLAAAAVAKIEAGLIDVGKPLCMSLGQDPHTGVIGPHSDLLIHQSHASIGLHVVALHGDQRLPHPEHPQPAAGDLLAHAHARSM